MSLPLACYNTASFEQDPLHTLRKGGSNWKLPDGEQYVLKGSNSSSSMRAENGSDIVD